MSAFSQMQDFRDSAVASLREAEETITQLQFERSEDREAIHEYTQHIDLMRIRHDDEVARLKRSVSSWERQYKELLTTYREALDKYRAEARELRRRRC
jgi:hypothetical protein